MNRRSRKATELAIVTYLETGRGWATTHEIAKGLNRKPSTWLRRLLEEMVEKDVLTWENVAHWSGNCEKIRWYLKEKSTPPWAVFGVGPWKAKQMAKLAEKEDETSNDLPF